MSDPNDTIRVSRALQDDAKEIIEDMALGVQVHKEVRALCNALIAATPQEQPRRFTDEERRELQACVCEIPCDCCNVLKAMLAESAPEGT